MKENVGNPLHLKSLNHISICCRTVEKSLDFYVNVLGFDPIKRPGSFDFERGLVPLILKELGYSNMVSAYILYNLKTLKCESMGPVEKKLTEMGIEYVRGWVEEGGIMVDQLFFHDPDGFMIEIYNCDVLPMVPIGGGEPIRACSLVTCSAMQQQQNIQQTV